MIIIMGSVGSGKTEQGNRLVQKLGCQRISTSQLLRDHPDKKWHDHIRRGQLVNDQDVINILQPALVQAGADRKELILDGAPRSLPQAQWLVQQIKSGRIKLTAIINLKVSDNVVIGRLLGRGREDDKLEVITKRLQDYHRVTQPVIDYLQNNGLKIHQLNGAESADKVEAQINNILKI